MHNLLHSKPFLRLTLFAFLLNALLPFFATYQVPASASAMSAAFGESVLLCTGDGFKLVKWEELESGKEKPAPHKKYQCALCFVAAHGTFLQPSGAGAEVAATALVSQAAWQAKDDAASFGTRWQRFRTRAPPAFLMS